MIINPTEVAQQKMTILVRPGTIRGAVRQQVRRCISSWSGYVCAWTKLPRWFDGGCGARCFPGGLCPLSHFVQEVFHA